MCVIHNYAAHIARDQEVSGNKLTKWLANDDRLHQAIREDGISLLLITLECDLILVCKQQRQRQTTQGLIEETLRMEQKNIDQRELLYA